MYCIHYEIEYFHYSHLLSPTLIVNIAVIVLSTICCIHDIESPFFMKPNGAIEMIRGRRIKFRPLVDASLLPFRFLFFALSHKLPRSRKCLATVASISLSVPILSSCIASENCSTQKPRKVAKTEDNTRRQERKGFSMREMKMNTIAL